MLQKTFKDNILFNNWDKFYLKKMVAQKIQISKDSLLTFNDFQMLLGDVNWLMPHLKLNTGDVKALFDVRNRDHRSVRLQSDIARECITRENEMGRNKHLNISNRNEMYVATLEPKRITLERSLEVPQKFGHSTS